jgi:type IVB pilus formation R64 PilN family outer membrane protein
MGAAGSTGSQLSVVGAAGRASANPELGLLVVTARPAVLDRVAAYVDSINARFAQNVLIDIKVYSLALDGQAALGFSLDALYNRLGQYGVSVVGAAPLQAATGAPGQLTIRASDPASRWNGSQLFAQALSQFGQVALQTQGQVLAINGQPSPIQVANEVNYLASSATSAAANVGTTSTLTPGSRVVGFTANFLPLILGDSRILLQYQMQISALTALTQVSSGGNSIQTPQIASQSLQQQAFVRDGQAIVLFGFDQTRDTLDSAAGLGGASRASRGERQLVVIVMQVNAGGQDG